MTKYDPDRWPNYKLNRWLKAMTAEVVVEEKIPTSEEIEAAAIVEKLLEHFPDFPQVGLNMDFDGKPYNYDSSNLRVKSLEILGDNVLFNFDVNPENSNNPCVEISRFFGHIGINHFSNTHYSNSIALKAGRYALYGYDYKSVNECMEKEGECPLVVNKEALMRVLEVGFSSRVQGRDSGFAHAGR